MNKESIAICVLSTTTVVLAVYCGLLATRRPDARKPSGDLASQLQEEPVRLKSDAVGDKALPEVKPPSRTVDERSQPQGRTEPGATLDARNSAPEPRPAATMHGPLDQLTGTSDGIEYMRNQQKSALDKTHADLFAYLSFAPERLDQLKELMLARQMAGIDAAVQSRDSGLSEKQKRELLTSATEDIHKAESALKEFLGDDYGVFAEFEDTQPERELVGKTLAAKLKASGVTLSPDDEHLLIRLMYEERRRFDFNYAFNSETLFPKGRLSEQQIEDYMSEVSTLHERIIERAKPVLTDSANKLFSESLGEQRQNLAMAIKMSYRMFFQTTQ